MSHRVPEIPCWRDRITSRLHPLGDYGLLDIVQQVPWGTDPTNTVAIQTFVAFIRGRPFFWFINGPSPDPGWYITKLLLFWRSALADPNYRIPTAMMLAGGGCLGGNQVMFWTFEARDSAGEGGQRVATRWQRQRRTQFDWWADEFITTRFFFDVADNVNAVVWLPPPAAGLQDTEGEGEGEGGSAVESEGGGDTATATTGSREGTPRPFDTMAEDAGEYSSNDPEDSGSANARGSAFQAAREHDLNENDDDAVGFAAASETWHSCASTEYFSAESNGG
ncbi:uncharacterized protein BO66DRAFT_442160 [Aspergillus aculeatinus CBS 121060]|uniref:Uncharacterized protein n=1 Tax=Aspergillus aculeatinus CBS 121060 TaxID=1448322 RepID=A0ACD1GY08_9EURO|nr:hypothetical protein BO66DRAFT_442160 [Aspergillus aculeatinus CBS 121060]RAH66361.1 hypothetical protein BO66DRAFT_442160 [Aspergillus aculeatinus CBS 121060]